MACFSKKSFFFYLVLLLILCISVILALFEKNYKTKHGYSFFFGKRPLISVLVTSYNYEHYLRQTLDSILDQTYKKYEVIIVDDGSTDNSVELINEYTHRYPNFHLYQHEGGINKGLPASVKFGVEKAKGEYVAFLESDDYWRKDKLEEVVKMINKYPDAVLMSNGVFPFTDDIDLNIFPTKVYLGDIEKRLDEKNTIIADDNDLLFNIIPTMSSAVVRKNIFANLNIEPIFPNYLDIWLYRQILKKYPLYHIPKLLTYWRVHNGSYGDLGNRDTSDKKNQLITAIRKLLAND